MSNRGWPQLLHGAPWFRGPGRYPIAAYSEFMPAPRVGPGPYGDGEPLPCTAPDPFGWQVSEHEEEAELAPGLEQVAREVVHALVHLGEGRPAHGISRAKLEGNPYWPPALQRHAGHLPDEAYVVLLPLALSRTQDDLGRVRWTLFGGSELGPERAFWQSFFRAPGVERPPDWGRDFLGRLLQTAYGEAPGDLGAGGLRVLPGPGAPVPTWLRPLELRPDEPLARVRHLLTFRPFGALPAAVRRRYLDGRLHLLPFPGSLVFFGAPPYVALERELPFAQQIPLLQACTRSEHPHGLRVPQSGVMHEHRPAAPPPDERFGPRRDHYRRTHRWARVHRHEDALQVAGTEDHVAHVLFSTDPTDLGLYGKPMARNAQLWTGDFHCLLDGPRADRAAIERAAAVVRAGGTFGYRFLFPPLRVGRHELYWHRPLVACRPAGGAEVVVLRDGPLGYLTAYDARHPGAPPRVELWPRLLARPARVAVPRAFPRGADRREHHVAQSARQLWYAARRLGELLPPDFARQLVVGPKELSLDAWLAGLAHGPDPAAGRALADELRSLVGPAVAPPAPLTYGRTATRRFEVAYWRTIARLATRFVTKENADCVADAATRAARRPRHRQLDALGDWLLAYYRRLAARARTARPLLVGDLPFRWETDLEYPWMGGWRANQAGRAEERNLLVVIPGRDRGRAVIMADHYDTAYMEDRYDPPKGNGARLAAAGADDNHSATAALMLAAPTFVELARAGRLAHDVWLVHLTGEEFPSDCMGARHLAQWLVEGSLAVRLGAGRTRDLSRTRVEGVYVLDMVAHNHERDRDVFQIAPGAGPGSLRLARAAQAATAAWNAAVPAWNARRARRGCGRGVRRQDPATVPPAALHPHLHGEVRPVIDPRSALYNTDGQIFSDAGVPVVLFMENYDISRTGYHDTHDTMENIDLDYGAAVAAVAIETVAQVASVRRARAPRER
jgi:hypothetical protein